MSEAVDIAIGVVEGKVVLQWHQPTSEMICDPKNAYKIGLALSKAALDAHTGEKRQAKSDVEFIDGELSQTKTIVTDLQRDAMIAQVATIVRTFMEQKKSPGYIAMHCVDAVLKETTR